MTQMSQQSSSDNDEAVALKQQQAVWYAQIQNQSFSWLNQDSFKIVETAMNILPIANGRQ